MQEVIWHARGGQGAFTAARALGAAASLDANKYALAFPTFGPERRGAPMRAYTKMSSAPIGNRSAVSKGDIVVYLDDTLFGEGWEAEAAEGGTVLVNSKAAFDDPRVIALDASGLAAEIMGRPIPNTVFLGAIAAVSNAVTLDDVCEGIRQTMPPKLHDPNIKVVKAAYDLTLATLAEERDFSTPPPSHNLTGDGPDVRFRDTDLTGDGPDVRFRDTTNNDYGADSNLTSGPSPVRFEKSPSSKGVPDPTRIIPRLQPFTAQPADYARNTCFEGGFLTSTNAGWRSERPIIDHSACTLCLTCYMMCPDGTIYKRYVEGDGGTAKLRAIAIDYDFCKGCGVCAQVCPADCIVMMEEGEPAPEPTAASTTEPAAPAATASASAKEDAR